MGRGVGDVHLRWWRARWSALAQESALRVADGPGRRGQDDGRIIHVAVGEERRIGVLPRVRVHRMRHLHERAQLHLHPPRVRYDDALLDVAAGETDRLAVVALLADAVGSRRTTTRRLLAVVDRRSRLSNRGWLRSVLEDIAAGTCSVLEHAYLRDVERAHGLPPAIRQQRVVTAGRVTYRDACYGGVVVELDGRRFHDSAQARDADLDRDLSAAANGELTVRLGWGQVFGRPCETAMALIKILRAAGVSVAPTPCGPECPVADSSYRAPR